MSLRNAFKIFFATFTVWTLPTWADPGSQNPQKIARVGLKHLSSFARSYEIEFNKFPDTLQDTDLDNAPTPQYYVFGQVTGCGKVKFFNMKEPYSPLFKRPEVARATELLTKKYEKLCLNDKLKFFAFAVGNADMDPGLDIWIMTNDWNPVNVLNDMAKYEPFDKETAVVLDRDVVSFIDHIMAASKLRAETAGKQAEANREAANMLRSIPDKASK